jgi:hypothetical protein
MEFETTGYKSIKFEFNIGNINFEKSDNSKVYLKLLKPLPKDCKIVSEIDDGELEIKTSKSFFSFKSVCKTELSIKVPQSLDIEFENGTGNLNVKDLTGELEYEIGSGNIDVRSPLKKLEGEAGSGNLRSEGVLGDIDIEHGSGKIDIFIKKITSAKKIEIEVGSGDVFINLNENMKVFSNVSVGSGKIISDVNNDHSALLKLYGSIGSGNLLIKNR